MISFKISLQTFYLKGTLGPMQIEPREYVKRKQVAFANERKKGFFFIWMIFHIDLF